MPRLFIHFLLECVSGSDRSRANRSRAGINFSEPPLEIGEWRQRIFGARKDESGACYPTPRRHVGDRIGFSDEVLTACELVIEHAVVSLCFTAEPVDRVRQLLR